MKNTALIPLAATLLVGCATDNPDEVEEKANLEYVGDWTLTNMVLKAEIGAEVVYLQGDSVSGSMTVASDLAAMLDTTHSYTYGDEERSFDLDFSGTATPLTDVASFSMDLTGEGELPLVGDWECTVDAEELRCAGIVVADEEDPFFRYGDLPLTAEFTSN